MVKHGMFEYDPHLCVNDLQQLWELRAKSRG